MEAEYQESKVAEPERFSEKKGNEVYRWFVQLRLVFRGKPRTYSSDKVAYALSYMSGAALNWAMLLLQALDEGHGHDLLENYNALRESVIGWEMQKIVSGGCEKRALWRRIFPLSMNMQLKWTGMRAA